MKFLKEYCPCRRCKDEVDVASGLFEKVDQSLGVYGAASAANANDKFFVFARFHEQ